MRVVIFFLYLCFHLLGGGNYLHADRSHDNAVISSLTKNEKTKLINTNHSITFIVEASIDLEEECFSGRDLKDDIGANKIFAKKNNLLDKWYLTHSNQFFINYYNQCFKLFLSFCGYSNPIYITQRALRI